jgi:PST family polysaccharide transporter
MGLLLSISVFFSSTNAVPEAILMREKRFLLAAIRNITVCMIAGGTAIVLALQGFHYYALIGQSVASAILTFGFNAMVTRIRFYPAPDFRPVRRLMRFSVFQSLFDAVNFFSRNMDNLLAGKCFGKERLGLYNKAYSLTLYPVNNLAGAISPVLHPILSDYQAESEKLYRKIMPVIRIMGIAGAVIAPFCFFEGRELILIVIGNQWTESIECFRVLSLSLYAQMLNQCVSSGFQSLGKTKQMFVNGLINTGITIVAILIGIFEFGDIYGLALCVSIAYIIRFFIAYYILMRFGFQRSFVSFLREISPELILLAVMFVAVMAIRLPIGNIYYSFIVKGVIMFALYGLLLVLTGDWKLIRNVLLSPKKKENA